MKGTMMPKKRKPGVTRACLDGMMLVSQKIEAERDEVQRKIDALLAVREMAERGEINVLVLAPSESDDATD